jgi:hypothetical protein
MVWVKFIQAFEKCSGGNWRGASATDDGVLRCGAYPPSNAMTVPLPYHKQAMVAWHWMAASASYLVISAWY